MKIISNILVISMILLGVVILALPADSVFGEEFDPSPRRGISQVSS